MKGQPNKDETGDQAQTRRSVALSRRDFIKRSAVAGLSVSSFGAILAACGNGAVTGETGTTGTTATTSGTAAAAGGFDPRAFEGATVKIALVDGERDEKGLQDKIAEIKERFGIDVELSTSAIGALIEQNNQNLRAPESAFDIVHILGFTVSSTVGAGLLEQLNPYVESETKTPADYDFSDFPDCQL